jgi:hypothetical protein
MDKITEDKPAAYNIPRLVHFDFEVIPRYLKDSINLIVNRHEILRARFLLLDGEPVQTILDRVDISLPTTDLSDIESDQRDVELHCQARALGAKHIDLAKGAPFSFRLFRLDKARYTLLVILHHIVSDAWTSALFLSELMQAYNQMVAGARPELPDLPIQYPDYAVWQLDWLAAGGADQQLEYWRQRLEGPIPVLELSSDHPRPPVQSFQGAQVPVVIDRAQVAGLERLCSSLGSTLFMGMLAAFNGLLYRYSNQGDLITGTPIANRRQAWTENLLGVFVNMLPIRTSIDDKTTFEAFIRQTREVTLDALQHQDLPLEILVKELAIERDPSRSPLFQAAFALQNVPLAPPVDGIRIIYPKVDNGTAKFDLMLQLYPGDNGELTGFIEFSTALFERQTIRRFREHLGVLLEELIANPGQRIADALILTGDERHRQLVEWNATRSSVAQAKTAHQLFEDQAYSVPDAIAVTYAGDHLSYPELNRRSNQLAHWLLEQGAGPETLIAVCLERTPEMIVAMLAIMKAGGAYLPLDPDYPGKRLSYIVHDSGAEFVISSSKLDADLAKANSARVVHLDNMGDVLDRYPEHNPALAHDASSLAYVIYTSGSTGQPKGVMIEHGALAAFLHWSGSFFTKTERSVTLASTSFSFDVSVLELFGTLSAGRVE